MSQDDDDPAPCSGPSICSSTNRTKRTKVYKGTTFTLTCLVVILNICEVVNGYHHSVQDVRVVGFSRTRDSAFVRFRYRCGIGSSDEKTRNGDFLLDVGLAKHKCEPPFVAETQAKIGCIAGDQIGQKTDTYVATEFSLPQDSTAFNTTYKVCVRPAHPKPHQIWRTSTFLFLPPLSQIPAITDNGSDHVINDNQPGHVITDDKFGHVINKDEGSDEFVDDDDLGRGVVASDHLFSQDESQEDALYDWSLDSTSGNAVDWKSGNAVDWTSGNPGDWQLSRVRRQEAETTGPRVLDLRLEDVTAKTAYTDDGRITLLEGVDVTIYLVGMGLVNSTMVRFTTSVQNYSDKCGYDRSHSKTKPFAIETTEDEGDYAKVFIPGSSLNYLDGDNLYFICVQDPVTEEYIHQGQNKHLQIEIYTLLLPNWLSICLLVILLCLSGLFSGLNLGLMSLDQTELRIVMNTGSDKEKSYAKAIMPIRGMGNFLLCSILLGNVLVNNTLTILLDTLTGGGGIVAVIGATLGIVVFGEIIPQAICSRHGLAVGANTILLTKFFMFVTAPLAYPISKLLDKILGAEIGTVYNRERLMELIKVTDAYTDLEKDEVKIVTGALVLKQKTVKDVMTKLDDCYMLPLNTILNFETVSEIKEQGYSRIPVYENDISNVKHILFAKDLLFIDPDDNKPLEEICKFYKNDVNFVYQDTALNDMFDEFKSGEKGHMAMVQEVNTEGDGDPYYETVGLLTLEDIIEEIIQQEINDETDVIMDNKTKKKRKKHHKKDADFKMFMESKSKRVNITPHLSLAILQFLNTTVKAFHSDIISRRILQKLLNMDVYREIKLKKVNFKKDNQEEDENEGLIIQKGKPTDYFILIIEGRVQITIGQENHKFIEGPFTGFGEQMLEQAMAQPISPTLGGGPGMNGGDPTRGTSVSLSLHSSVNEAGFLAGRPLKKTNTQLNIDTSSNRRAGSADSGMPYLSSNKPVPFIPDYAVKFITDGIYLKIRKATYLVALKASRMNNLNSDSGVFNEKELDYALERVTEDDDDFGFTPHCRSPDKYFDPNGPPRSNTGTPTTDVRRESLRSSLSTMKSRFMGNHLKRSNTSIDKSKDEFWDGMTNPALDNRSEDMPSDLAVTLNGGSGVLDTSLQGSSPGGIMMNNITSYIDGPSSDEPLSLPLKQRDQNFESMQTPPSHTTVISVRGSSNTNSINTPPSDPKSLAITIPENRSGNTAAQPGGAGGDSTGTTTTTMMDGVGGGESTASSGRTVTTGVAEFNNGETASKQSSDGGQLSPTDRTSLLGANHTVS